MNRWMGLAAAVMLAACGDEAVTVEQADGVTLEDVGGDVPDIGAPDVRVDDSGGNPADVVQSETGVDAGPDAVVDDAGDAAAEVVQPAGQCLGPFDGAARAEGAAELVHVASIEAAGDCARDGSELVSCTATLVGSRLELTPGCATCAAELAACAADECYETCEADPAGPECGWCYRESGCEEAYAACSGLEPWAWEPVCGGQPFSLGLMYACVFDNPDNPAEVEACLRRRYETFDELSTCDTECLVPYNIAAAEACPMCVVDQSGWCSTECADCVIGSQAAQVVTFCGGSAPTFPIDERCD